MEQFFFYLFSGLAIGGALGTVTRRNPLTCALCLVVTFIALSGLYLLNAAPFAAIVQIVVYAGAIMVLVVFVIMFLNLPEAELEDEKISKPGLILSLFLLAPLMALCVGAISGTVAGADAVVEEGFGSIEMVGGRMFEGYLFQFEAVSLLLLVAIVGAVMLAKKKV